MLVNQNETRNWTAISAIADGEGNASPVMYMNASYNGKDLNIQKSIQNQDLYKTHRQEVNTDYNTFEETVMSEIGD